MKTHKAPLTAREHELLMTHLKEAIKIVDCRGMIDESKLDEWGLREDKDSSGNILPRRAGPSQLHMQRMQVLSNPVRLCSRGYAFAPSAHTMPV